MGRIALREPVTQVPEGISSRRLRFSARRLPVGFATIAGRERADLDVGRSELRGEGWIVTGGGIGSGNGGAQFTDRNTGKMIDARPVAPQYEVAQAGTLLVADQAPGVGKTVERLQQLFAKGIVL